MTNKLEYFQSRWPNMFVDVYCGFCLPAGWTQLVVDLCEKLSSEVKCAQVKEKFGGLRFYVDGGTEYDRELIAAAERRSFATCQECGRDAAVVVADSGWLRALCAECR